MSTYGAIPAGQGSPLSCQRIVPIPFAACVAALDSWQLTAPGGELRLGPNVLRPPLRMRLDIDHWSAGSSALELIPCGNVRPSAAYFRAAHHLLDSLVHALSEYGPAQKDLGHEAAGQPGSPVNVLKGGRLLPTP